MLKAPMINIKRFAVHDGPGVRTTLYLKGCSLQCVWCHNPEGISQSPQLAFYKEKCIGCGVCAACCKTGAHIFDTAGHHFRRDRCVLCGTCAENCLGEALTYYGREITAEEALQLLLEDWDFYGEKGGITLSGGECLLHADFCREVLCRAKAEHIHTAVDTCGFVPQENIQKVLPFTDLFLYDLKAIDNAVHIRCTAHPAEKILENLFYIDGQGGKTEIRIPFVPGMNDGEMEGIRNIVQKLHHATGVRILPYHSYAGAKYTALGMHDTLPLMLPTAEMLQKAESVFTDAGIKVFK